MITTRRGWSAAAAAATVAALALPAAGPSAAAPGAAASEAQSSGSARLGAEPDASFGTAARVSAMRAARADAARVGHWIGAGSGERLRAKNVERDTDGTRHVRYTRTLDGLPVLGGDLVVHESASGTITGVDLAARNPLPAKAATPAVSRSRAALAAARAGHGNVATTPRQVIWAVSGVPRLAWLSRVTRVDRHGFGWPQAVVVDARTGRLIQRWDLFETASGKGRSLYVGTVGLTTTKKGSSFQLKDPSRGNGYITDAHNKQNIKGTLFTDGDNRWGNGSASNRQTAAVDAAYGVAKTWDFYKSTFGRNGIKNNGKGVLARVHYAKRLDNAFWSDACNCMSYGDGGSQFKPVVGLDVAGHEMTHGITSATAGLYYFGDSGGLNEANSDIFGSLVEFYTHNSKDPGDYLIGEKIMKPGAGPWLRRMDHPSVDGFSYDCWTTSMGLDDPHATSGVGNHFFYLLAEGSGAKTINGVNYNAPVCAGGAVSGIGRAAAGKIWYRTLTRYLVSTTGYIDARDASIHAAIDLYGLGSSQCNAVAAAWTAVAVPEQYWTCAAGQLNEGANTFGANAGFESGGSGWSLTGSAVVTTNLNVGLPHAGTHYAMINALGSNNTGTISRTITVPNSATAMLRVWMLISSGQFGDGTVTATFNGNTVATWDGSYANNTYQRWDVPLAAYAGQTGTLVISSTESVFVSGDYFQVLLDDFTLTQH